MVKLSTIIDLPPDDDEAFLEFEVHAREALGLSTANAHPEESWEPYWLTYMTHVREAAIEFGVEKLAKWAVIPPISYDEFQSFDRDVLATTTRLKFRVARRLRGEILQPQTSDREKIRFRVGQLRDEIAASNLPADRKSALNKKLDELVGEFDGTRVNRGKVLVTLTAIAVLLNQTQGLLLKAPETFVVIMDTISMFIGAEEERRALLERYRQPLAIEDHSDEAPTKARTAQSGSPRTDFSAELDDEIPF